MFIFLRVLSPTLILSKNSRVLDAKSRQNSANLSYNQLKIGQTTLVGDLLFPPEHSVEGSGGSLRLRAGQSPAEH